LVRLKRAKNLTESIIKRIYLNSHSGNPEHIVTQKEVMNKYDLISFHIFTIGL
jgi:hypothetical protein